MPESLDLATFDEIASMSNDVQLQSMPGLPPFQGGTAGLFGYDLCQVLERIPPARHDDLASPRLAVGVYDWVISFDHEQGRAWLVSTGFDGMKVSEENARKRLEWVKEQLRLDSWLEVILEQERQRMDWVHEQLRLESAYVEKSSEYTTMSKLVPQCPLRNNRDVTSNFSRDGYIEAVRQAVEYVHAGDIFQVNISQRLLAPQTEHPLELYGRLRERNPSPFACYFDIGQFQIASASPERFVQVTPDGKVRTKPIKGTRPRGKTTEADAALIRDLLSNPKDRAENVMIVDLLRNDLGRVCEYGSVRVPRVCELETYPFVHHLVSEVVGQLRPGLSGFDLLAAAFPGGSVTGAPKVRAMEIIAELEPTARGPYCGSIGFIGFNRAMDTNILIRTFTAGRGWLQFPVGGGVVADSDPATEYEETLHKAAGLLRALEP